jgi:hypothetical protein
VTRASHGSSTIENVLNGQVDFITRRIPRNLDAIRQGGKSSMSPAAAAVSWNVLVQRLGEIARSVDIAPGKIVGKLILSNVRVRKRRVMRVLHFVAFQNLENRNCVSFQVMLRWTWGTLPLPR